MSRTARLLFLLATGSLAFAVAAAPTTLRAIEPSIAFLALAGFGVTLLARRA